MDIEYYFVILPYLFEGLILTLRVFALTILFSLPLGIVVGSLATLKNRLLSIIIGGYTWIFRGTPLLLQLYFGMYGLPIFGIVLDRMTVAVLVFTLNYGAYFTEIIRGGLLSISDGQKDAANVLGFTKAQTFFYVSIPRALKRSLQSVSNETITLVKDTALIAAVALNDVLRNAKEIVSRDLRVDAFFIIAIFYITISFIVVQISKRVERKYGYFN